MFKIDKDKCLRCGACVGTCNEVFDFVNDDVEVVKQPTSENMDLTIEAMEGCPTGAIEKE